MGIKHFKTAEFDAAVAAAPLAMVDFWADWCGPCKMLSPVIESLADQYEGKVLVGKVNVDEEPDLARRFGVMSIPTVVFPARKMPGSNRLSSLSRDSSPAIRRRSVVLPAPRKPEIMSTFVMDMTSFHSACRRFMIFILIIIVFF